MLTGHWYNVVKASLKIKRYQEALVCHKNVFEIPIVKRYIFCRKNPINLFVHSETVLIQHKTQTSCFSICSIYHKILWFNVE